MQQTKKKNNQKNNKEEEMSLTPIFPQCLTCNTRDFLTVSYFNVVWQKRKKKKDLKPDNYVQLIKVRCVSFGPKPSTCRYSKHFINGRSKMLDSPYEWSERTEKTPKNVFLLLLKTIFKKQHYKETKAIQFREPHAWFDLGQGQEDERYTTSAKHGGFSASETTSLPFRYYKYVIQYFDQSNGRMVTNQQRSSLKMDRLLKSQS